MNPYQAALGIFWSVYVLSLAQLNKSLLEEETLQLSGKGLAKGNINKTLSEPLDPGTAVALAQSSASTSTARGQIQCRLFVAVSRDGISIQHQRWSRSSGLKLGREAVKARVGQMLPLSHCSRSKARLLTMVGSFPRVPFGIWAWMCCPRPCALAGSSAGVCRVLQCRAGFSPSQHHRIGHKFTLAYGIKA